MKSYQKELWFSVPGRRAFINITSQVQEALRESGIQEGLVLVSAMHITASVFLSLCSGQASRMMRAACTTIMRCGSKGWRHMRPSTSIGITGRARPVPRNRGNDADARLKRHGPPSAAVVVAVTNGRLDFGTRERILCQLDG